MNCKKAGARCGPSRKTCKSTTKAATACCSALPSRTACRSICLLPARPCGWEFEAQAPGAVEQPRVLLVAVPYALKASDSDTLGGKPASAYALAGSQTLLAPSAVPGSSSSSSAAAQSGNPSPNGAPAVPQPASGGWAVTSDGTATANSIAMFTANPKLQSSAITQTSGNIGIGGASPPGTNFQITDTPARTEAGRPERARARRGSNLGSHYGSSIFRL